MSVTVDDVAASIGARASGLSNYASSLPGQIWFGRAPDTPTTVPYGVFTIKAAAGEYFSGDAYIQKFTVSVMGYCPVGANATVSPSTVERFFNEAFVWAAGTPGLGMTLRGSASGELVLASKPLDASGVFDTKLRQARDVFTNGQAFEILCQGNRSVS